MKKAIILYHDQGVIVPALMQKESRDESECRGYYVVVEPAQGR
jgi:hypothetical protein